MFFFFDPPPPSPSLPPPLAQVDALQARRAQVERTVQELEQREWRYFLRGGGRPQSNETPAPLTPPPPRPPSPSSGLACETDAEAALAADLDAARAEAASLPAQLEKLRAAAADAEAALAARASAADADTAAAQARVRKLEAAVAGYEAATGVTIVSPTDPTDTELRIVFARLDAAAPAAVATLGVRVGDGPGAAWTVTRCEPATPRAGALARELASGRLEFAAYVRAMRGEFKGVVGRRGAA